VSELLDAVREELLEMMRADQDALFRSGSDPRASAKPLLRANAAQWDPQVDRRHTEGLKAIPPPHG